MGDDQPPHIAQAAPAEAQTGNNAMNWLIRYLVSCVVVTLGIAIYFQIDNIESSLTAATWGLAIVVLLWVGLALFWGEINPPAQTEPDLSALLRNAANVVITVDGVVLGLVYTFLGTQNRPIPLTVKVGALALVAGVVLALLLYALVGGKITSPAAVSIATGLFSLTSWALAYGLLCIVFALVIPST